MNANTDSAPIELKAADPPFSFKKTLRRPNVGPRWIPSNWFTVVILLLSVLLLTACSAGAAATKPRLEIRILENGIQAVSVYFPGSTNVSIFTFLPMGLTSDGRNQAQWSHLIEHLVIRSTTPANSSQVNAETLPDHMRLDFYGNTNNWQEGLSHHRRWLVGIPFTEETLQAEIPKVIGECDFTARNYATHKFAVAAWSQGLRHQEEHVALKKNVTDARLADLQQLRDERLPISGEITLCVVGGLKSEEVFARVEEEVGSVLLKSAPVPTSKPVPQEELNLTWDLEARHLLLTWPAPEFNESEHAALIVAAHLLNMEFAKDAKLRELTGMILAGADLRTPEGTHFFLSASLKPAASFEEVHRSLLKHLEALSSEETALVHTVPIGRQLSALMKEVPDPRQMISQTSSQISPAMIEGNIGLQAGMRVHRYRENRISVAEKLAGISATKVRMAVTTHLPLEKVTVCRIRPVASE